MVGFKKNTNITEYNFPSPLEDRISLKKALENFGEPNKKDVCNAAFSSRYMSRNRKRNWNEVSYTIPAMSKQVTLHPSSPDMFKVSTDNWEFGKGKTTRRFSWQEAAAIQTFPADLEFSGNLTSKYKQIGNAVPVKLAETVAKDIYYILENLKEDHLADVRNRGYYG